MSSRPQSRTGTKASSEKTGQAAQPNDSAAQPKDGADHPSQRTVTLGGLKLPVPAVGPKRALWWGGLAALAVVGALEWPVAVVVGAGTYVAEQFAREDARNDLAGQG